MVKIRLTRIGRKQVPVYGIIVAEEKMPEMVSLSKNWEHTIQLKKQLH